jgi:hypothetical protein
VTRSVSLSLSLSLSLPLPSLPPSATTLFFLSPGRSFARSPRRRPAATLNLEMLLVSLPFHHLPSAPLPRLTSLAQTAFFTDRFRHVCANACARVHGYVGFITKFKICFHSRHFIFTRLGRIREVPPQPLPPRPTRPQSLTRRTSSQRSPDNDS